MEIISVIITDDHVIFRKGLRTILNEISFVKVIGEASNGSELLDLIKLQTPDIILMDIRMPVMDGIEAAQKITKKYPDIKIIALTMHEEIGYFNKMIDVGAAGFLLKNTTKTELQNAIAAVFKNEHYFSEEFLNAANQRFPKKNTSIQLTDREQEILEYICKGLSNAEMAKMLGISQKTVDGHRMHLFEKTGAKNAPNLVLFAIKNGLIKT